MLNIGDVAPDFSCKDQHGNTVSLATLKGKQVVLYFYPKDDTPGCTTEAIGFTKLSDQFLASNTVVLGVSKDSVSSHEAFCHKYSLKITLLSDEDMSIITPYGVWQEKKNYGKTYMGIARTTYLIDDAGRIKRIFKNVKAEGHAEAVLQAVQD